jgi:hypothetical protein
MGLTKLILITSEKDAKGNLIFKRLDTEEFIPKENIRTIKQPPLLLLFDSPSTLPIYIERKRGFRDKVNALLIGEKVHEIEGTYYSASYCKI